MYYSDWFEDDEPFLLLEINPTWLWHTILLIYCFIQFASIFWGFLYLRSSRILVCNLLFCGILSWFCYLGNAGFVKCIWKVFLLFHFLEEFEKDECKFFVYLVKFACEAVWVWILQLFLMLLTYLFKMIF